MSVTYRQHDNYTDIYGGKMANCCQKVRGNKPKTKQQQNKKQKQNKKQTNKQKQKQKNNKNKTGRWVRRVIKQITTRMLS